MELKTLEISEEMDPVELRAFFCVRLNQAVNLHPELIHPGRARINDFATTFDIHYQTAARLLNGSILPATTLLYNIATKLEVSVSWLLGLPEYPLGQGALNLSSVSSTLDGSFVKILIFKPRSSAVDSFALIPASELPSDFINAQLIYARTRSEAVIVKLMTGPQHGNVHLTYDPKTGDTYLLRINVIPSRGELLCVRQGETGAMEIHKLSDVAFGEKDITDRLCILGPVVARIKFGFNGD